MTDLTAEAIREIRDAGADVCGACDHPRRWHHPPSGRCTEWGCRCDRFEPPEAA